MTDVSHQQRRDEQELGNKVTVTDSIQTVFTVEVERRREGWGLERVRETEERRER